MLRPLYRCRPLLLHRSLRRWRLTFRSRLGVLRRCLPLRRRLLLRRLLHPRRTLLFLGRRLLLPWRRRRTHPCPSPPERFIRPWLGLRLRSRLSSARGVSRRHRLVAHGHRRWRADVMVCR